MSRLRSKLSPSITTMIRMDHSAVLAIFHKYHPSRSAGTRRALVNTASLAIEVHAQLEEEIFYPAMRELATDRAVLDKSVPEHGKLRRLIGELREMSPTADEYDRTFMELMRELIHHVADEETVLLPDAERLLDEAQLRDMGARMTRRRLQLSRPRAGEFVADAARAMPKGTLVLAAGAVLAGGWLLRRTLAAVPRH